MNRSLPVGIAAALGFACAACLSTPAFAQDNGQKHDSNTLHKAGRAIKKAGKAVEYGVRKTGEDTTVGVHRALGKNSKVRDRAKKKDYIVTPKGQHIPVAAANHSKRLGSTNHPAHPAHPSRHHRARRRVHHRTRHRVHHHA